MTNINEYVSFFGPSGVGKTTLIKELPKLNPTYVVPKLTVTRDPRPNDDLNDFEYLSVDEYLDLRRAGRFFLDIDNDNQFYGYRSEVIDKNTQIPLLYASPYQIDDMDQYKSIKLLIDGSNSLQQIEHVKKTQRLAINEVLNDRFYGNIDFRKRMDIIFMNTFANPDVMASILNEKILNLLNKKV